MTGTPAGWGRPGCHHRRTLWPVPCPCPCVRDLAELIPLLFAVKAAGGLALSMSPERRELVLGTGLPLGHVVHHQVPLRSRPRFSAARVSPACSRSGKRQGPAPAPPLWGLLEEAGVERHDVDEQGNREAG